MKYIKIRIKKLLLKSVLILFGFAVVLPVFAQKLLIPMDLSQTDHLKAYGLVYWILKQGQPVDWLLNYRGGSFMTEYNDLYASECRVRGVSFEQIDGAQAASIYAEVQSENVNMDVVKLEKPPRVAVYAPPGSQPWDDAVRLALDYAEIEHDIIWDEEVMGGKLDKYDWLHLHHEDFTGQYGKFWASYNSAPWYIEQVALNEGMAKKLGFSKVSELKKAVVRKITEFVANGGFLFAMCSATDTYDIAIAAMNIDICGSMFDGDPADPDVNSKLDFSNTFAFENFKLIMDPYVYEYSNIDVTELALNNPDYDYFTLFDFSAKYDPVPTMLTQDHANVIHGFMGQTTAFHKEFIKKNVTILGERDGSDEVRYIHGNIGRGTFTWYGGHDPEDYRHFVYDKETDLHLFKNSPGYRLILNNILFPAAKKKKQKT
ncbi:MAG: asparagine synthetase B [Ignavibacteria bacterium GWB2_35_12]|nr:MAG: asparagine synthetase B [Ignavibacteria bacterium GWA2_35_8]OGU38062.1 MAG: asparagine synthetase B [Ignavibacteria bacterium GWB2_35_12]OGU95179.1 MAG: asparagine synthetase B [Ignavibacteria bacterium RIFOXYA2_FULL_35_10]OGV25016.1 MAG: asparagine synthetase B [Ignavibacteria bacterium RIFOXYC2_FULL_35_21]